MAMKIKTKRKIKIKGKPVKSGTVLTVDRDLAAHLIHIKAAAEYTNPPVNKDGKNDEKE